MARSHVVANGGPIALDHNLDHSFLILPFIKLCHPILVWYAAALLSSTWFAQKEVPKGGRGRE
jgi:hypothetical protein